MRSSWDGPETKEKLRRFSFHGALSYRPKIAFQKEIADLMEDEELL